MTNENINPKIQGTFDPDWYYVQYSHLIDKMKLHDESLLDYYLRVGARLGHDPHADFSEIMYRCLNSDVYMSLLKKQDMFGYMHYIAIGHTEARTLPTPMQRERTRRICAFLDPEFLERAYEIDTSKYISPFDFYFKHVNEMRLSPSAMFSEPAYRQDYPDVDEMIKAGKLSSGFQHFIETIDLERRSYRTVAEQKKRLREKELEERKVVLEANVPRITHPHAFDMLGYFDFWCKEIEIEIEQGQGFGMVVLVPHFLPEILFGGYLAFFDFLSELKTRCQLDLRLIVLNLGTYESHKQNIMRMKLVGDKKANIFSSIQFMGTDRTIRIPSGYKVMSYCADTHYVADQIASRLGGLPFFFIQEYEPDFHAQGDGYTFTRNAFLLPHFGIYNSRALCDFFLEDAEMLDRHGPGYSWCSFENHVRKISLAKDGFLEKNRGKARRRLVFYGRPEQHAARNHFGTFVLGLRVALGKGYFDAEDWEFVSIGSLVYEGRLDLDGSRKLEIITKMPFAEYVDFLETGDIGVSFISTPHPGIVHFQMAAYGLVTVTNVTKRRSADWLSSINGNLIGVELAPASIAEGLRQAIERSSDLDTRYDNASSAPYLGKEDCLRPALDAVAAQFRRAP